MKDNSTTIKRSYHLSGMNCAGCANNVETNLKPLDGIIKVSVNFPNKSVAIEHDSNVISIEEIQKRLEGIGFKLFVGEDEKTRELFEESELKRFRSLKTKLIFSAIFSAPVFILAMFFMDKFPYENWVMLLLSIPVLFWSGSEFFVNAFKKLKHFSANMDTLVALSTGVAFTFSAFNTIYPQYFVSKGIDPHVYFESAVIIITLILLGRYFEERAKSKTSSAIRKLIGLKPKQVIVIRNGEEKTIPYDEIEKGEIIIVKPGDKIPVDGIVTEGVSFVDESMITGEPIPVEKSKETDVFAGTINQKGALRIVAAKVGNETLLSQIIKLVEKAQSSKPAIQKLADKIAGIFVPVVLGISIITFILWYILGPEPSITYSMLSLITVLIIACPCALGLATPTALMVGIGKGAEQGILIKDAQVLEMAYKVDTLILDKTGTITEGKPEVTDLIWNEQADSSSLKKVLLAIESQSEHPVAEAIVRHLKGLDTPVINIEIFESITGMGAISSFENTNYCVGNERLMMQNEIIIPKYFVQKAEDLKSEAKTVVYFGAGKKVEGIIAVADKIKDNAFKAIESIQQMGIDVHMLTGDNEQTARVIAAKSGIKNYQSNVMPADKGNFVMELQKQGRVVAMAGDGINDSHALAQSDVGIAMGSGTDIAMESAGITLINSDLRQISKAITLSKSTMRTIRQNLFWAFIYNIIAIPVAAGVLFPLFGFLLNPMIAGAAMSMSSISVLLNSLRLKKQSV